MRKASKIIGLVLGLLILLLIGVGVYVHTPFGRNLLKEQLVHYLEDKLKTKVAIEDLHYLLPNEVELKGLYIEDRKQDTLIYLRSLNLDWQATRLAQNTISVRSLSLDGLVLNVDRLGNNQHFNYQFIIDAFSKSSSEPSKSQTQNKPLKFDVQKLALNYIRLKYNDEPGGTYLIGNVGELALRPTSIDLEKNSYGLYDFTLKDAIAYLEMNESSIPETEEESEDANFQLAAKQLLLENIRFTMLSKTDSMYLYSYAGNIKGSLNNFDLLKEEINLDYINFENIDGAYVFGDNNGVPETVSQNEIEESNNWKIWANTFNISKANFKIDDPKATKLASGMDYSHMNFKQIFLNTDNVFYSADSISTSVKHLALKERSGLVLEDLRTDAQYTNHGAILNQLYLATPNTRIQEYLALHYPSLNAFTTDISAGTIDAKLKNSRIAVNDILLFTPVAYQEHLLPYKNQIFDFGAHLNGKLNSLKLNQMYLAGQDNLRIDLSGHINGLPDPQKLNYDLTIKEIKSNKKIIANYLPDSILKSYSLPEWVSVEGKIFGTINDYYPDLNIKTSDGDATIKGKMLMAGGTGNEVYDLDIITHNLNVGKILKQDTTIGLVSTKIHASGKGFDTKNIDGQVQINLSNAWLKGYRYENIIINGLIKNNIFSFKSQSSDPNISYLLNGRIDLQNKYPSGNINLNLQKANLNALKLSDDTIILAGKINADFESANPDYPFGNLSWANPFINYNGKEFYPNDIIIKSQPDGQEQNIDLNIADIFTGTAKGKVPLSKLSDALISHINQYYHISDSVENVAQYSFQFDGMLQHQSILSTALPGLEYFKPVPLHFYLNNDTLGGSLAASKITYNKNVLNNIQFYIKEENKKLNYALSLDKVETDLTALQSPSITGNIRNDSIILVANINDEKQAKQFTFGGVYAQDRINQQNSFTLFKGLRFDYNIWQVNPNNKIIFAQDGYLIRDLDISYNNQSVSVHNDSSQPSSPIIADIKNFSLANITKMFSKDTLLADGILNAKANVSLNGAATEIDASVFVDSLKAFDFLLGDLTGKIKNKDENTINAFISLDGADNHLQLYGDYYLKPVGNNDFHFNLLLKPLSLSSVQGLSFGNLKNSSGQLKGALELNGTIDKPIVTGSLVTKDIATTVVPLNAFFRLPEEQINFEKGAIVFKDFKIEDKKKNFATLNGQVFTEDYRDYELKLKLNAKEWQILDSKKKDNPEYYGKLIVSTNLDIKGHATAPEVNGNLTIHDSTDLHYALIDDGPGIVDHDGIVQFIDSRIPQEEDKGADSIAEVQRKRLHFSPSTQLNVNVDVNKNAAFTLVIDPATGDELQVKGQASLNASMDPSGTIGLTGTYEVQDGYYELNYNFLHRKFEIQKGSIVTLSGDPLEAVANITALYHADVAPFDLVEDAVSPDQQGYYKQRLPFQVALKIEGIVMKPDISFDILLPEDKNVIVSSNVSSLVQAKLTEIRNNPSELNKQVFALLIMNRFLANDPFSSASSSVNIEYAARKSVSRFLSDQLNMIAGQLIQGLELNFDLNSREDYSTGSKVNQTDLNITASKSLFNDRLKITIGNDFNLEGQSAPRQQSSLIPGNLAISYLLSRDGRYLLDAYRTNELQDIINGYVVETGLKFKASLNYNKFKYLFVNRKKYFEKLRAKRMEEQKNKSEQNDKNPDVKS